jgi:hypothetical protein
MMSSIVCLLKLFGAIIVLLNVASVSGSCIEKERHTLLELKSRLVLDDTTFYLLGTVRVMIVVHGKESVVPIKLAMLKYLI